MYKWTTPIAYHLFAASKQQKINSKPVAARESQWPPVQTIALQKGAGKKAGGAKKPRTTEPRTDKTHAERKRGGL